jgi:hypothetical protein
MSGRCLRLDIEECPYKSEETDLDKYEKAIELARRNNENLEKVPVPKIKLCASKPCQQAIEILLRNIERKLK